MVCHSGSPRLSIRWLTECRPTRGRRSPRLCLTTFVPHRLTTSPPLPLPQRPTTSPPVSCRL
ncbi:hypothetical protein E2C01_055132 [Portunus trituberculatus]|uniref:Uncharacterized protein n=1 Tax=Portunus trituberculatus TaxID=210409 RepID=A0A5B7GU03_PORTR|nr:hypothetical protein [Portunus trituberculatus]